MPLWWLPEDSELIQKSLAEGPQRVSMLRRSLTASAGRGIVVHIAHQHRESFLPARLSRAFNAGGGRLTSGSFSPQRAALLPAATMMHRCSPCREKCPRKKKELIPFINSIAIDRNDSCDSLLTNERVETVALCVGELLHTTSSILQKSMCV